MLRSSAISWSSVTDFCFSSAISTKTCSGSESGAVRHGVESGAQRLAQLGARAETSSRVAWGEVRGGEQPKRGSGQKIRLAKKWVKADRTAMWLGPQKRTYRRGSRLMSSMVRP